MTGPGPSSGHVSSTSRTVDWARAAPPVGDVLSEKMALLDRPRMRRAVQGVPPGFTVNGAGLHVRGF